MTMKVSKCAKAREVQCATCPFREGGFDLGSEKMAEIYGYLLQGVNHFCHSDRSNQTVCRGARSWQLSAYCSMGIISEPTDEALREAMRKMGIEPKGHV
jgi:hypothetical protein